MSLEGGAVLSRQGRITVKITPDQQPPRPAGESRMKKELYS